jgi:tape measure domain-containing protein
MADGRTVTLAVDVVSVPGGRQKVVAETKEIEREAKRASKDILEHAVRNAKAETKAKEEEARRQKKITDDLLAYKIRKAKDETAQKKAAADSFLAAVRRDAQQEISENKRKLAQIDAAEKRFYAERNRRAQQSADAFLKSMKAMQTNGAVSAGSRSLVSDVFLGSVAAQGFTALTSSLTQAGRAIFDFSSKMQQSQVSFASLMKDSQMAAKHIKELQDLTVKFPLDFSSIATMSQRLQGAGIAARDVIPLIKDIGNVAAATGDLGAERMEGLAVALSQVASKGIVSAEEMEQLAERGVPAWKLLSEAIGKTIGETRKMAEDGEISADLLFKAFQRMARVNFAGAMERQARTFSGAMKQIENVLMITASEAFKPFMDKITKLASDSSKEIKKQKGDWNRIGFTLGSALGQGVSAGVAEAVAKLPAIIAGTLTGIVRGMYQIGVDYSTWTMRQALTGFGALDGTRWGNAVNRSVDWASKQWGGTQPTPNQILPPSTNYARPNYSGKITGSGENRRMAVDSPVANAGGLPMPKKKDSRVNLNLKDEMADALAIASQFGLTVTSGRSGGHNKGSAHGSGGAFDLRTNGVPPAIVETAIQALRNAGYSVKDERVRPQGQKVWTGPHIHVGGKAGKGERIDVNREVSQYLQSESDRKTKEYEDKIVDGIIMFYAKTGLLPSPEMADKIYARISELARLRGDAQPSKIQFNADMANVFRAHQGRRLPDSIATDGAVISGEFTPRDLEGMPEDPLKKELERRNKEIWENFRREQEDAFEDARQGWEDLLTDLANGDFKSVWRNLKDAMMQQFIRPASQMLAQLFGNPFGGMQTAGGFGGQGGFGGFNLGGLFGGGGSMGPGGTPMFNPVSGGFNFAGGGSQSGQAGGLLGNLFGGGGLGSIFGGLFGRGGGAGAIGSAAGGLLGGGGGGALGSAAGKALGGGGGLMSKLGGIGGIASIGGMAASMIGGALGGKWGNFLSMAGMGTSIGASIGGPWGALIGGAIGAGAGLISMLFGRDNAEKKLKEAALSTYGITVKDKSVLKTLKSLGETMFGKGNVGKNAQQVVSSDQGQLILRNYAEATNQSSDKIDRLYIGDENWSGNQFRSKFGGFRAFGGPVSAGKSYIVGERGPELFTANQSGTITPNGGGMSDAIVQRLIVVLGQVEETQNFLGTKLRSIPKGELIEMAAEENPEAFGKAIRNDNSNNLRSSEMFHRTAGGAY